MPGGFPKVSNHLYPCLVEFTSQIPLPFSCVIWVGSAGSWDFTAPSFGASVQHLGTVFKGSPAKGPGRRESELQHPKSR